MSEEDSNESVLQDKRMQLFGDPKEEGNWRSSPKLMFSVYRGSPSITIFTNDESDSAQSPIRASLGQPLWQTFVEMVQYMANPNTQPGESNKIQIRNQSGNQVQINAEVVVGKDSEGVVYCSVIQGERPKKKIPFLPPNTIELYDSNGEPLSKAVKSSLFARSFITQIDKQVAMLVNRTWQPMPNQNGDGQGAASASVPGFEQSAGSQASAEMDELPM